MKVIVVDDEDSLRISLHDDLADAGFDVFLLDGPSPRLPVDRLSSGQLEIFMFAGTLIMEHEEEGIVLIDEPELHLDPQWHRSLLRSMSELKPRCQIIAATQHPKNI